MKKTPLKPNQKQILKDLRKQMDEVRAQCRERQAQRLMHFKELASNDKDAPINVEMLARALERL